MQPTEIPAQGALIYGRKADGSVAAASLNSDGKLEVAQPLTTPFLTAVQNFTPAAAYATNKSIGPRFVFDLGVANAGRKVLVSTVVLTALCTTTANATAALFEGDPVGSNFTDGGTAAVVQADLAKSRAGANSGNSVTGMGLGSWSFAFGRIVILDAAGKFYVAIAATGAISGITGDAAVYAEGRI